MEYMIREEMLTVSTSSDIASVPQLPFSGKSGPENTQTFAEACQVVALGMSKCSTPLCSPDDASSFVNLVTRIVSGTSEESNSIPGGSKIRGGKELVLACVNHVLPPASKSSPQQWQERVISCRKAVEKALHVPMSIRQLIGALDTKQHGQMETCLQSPCFTFDGFAARQSSQNLEPGVTDSANWLPETYFDGILSRWMISCQDAAMSCAMLHADVQRRFVGNITLMVLQTFHMIYEKIVKVYEIVFTLRQSDSQYALAPSFASIVVGLFKLASILAKVFSEKNSAMLNMAFSMILQSWKQKHKSSMSKNGNGSMATPPPPTAAEDRFEEGTNALFLISLDPMSRSTILHACMLHVMSVDEGATVASTCMIVSLRLFIQLSAMNTQCKDAILPDADVNIVNTNIIGIDTVRQIPRTEACTFLDHPTHAVIYLLLVKSHSLSFCNPQHGPLAMEILKFVDAEVDVLNTCTSHVMDRELSRQQFQKFLNFLCSSHSQHLFAWYVTGSRSRPGKGSLSRRERRALISNLWLYLFRTSLSDALEGALLVPESALNLGSSLIRLVETVTQMVNRHSFHISTLEMGDRSIRSTQLSGYDFDVIEMVVDVLRDSLIPVICPGVSLWSICGQWIESVWKENCVGHFANKLSPVSVTNNISSPVSVSIPCPKGSTVSPRQLLEVSCALCMLPKQSKFVGFKEHLPDDNIFRSPEPKSGFSTETPNISLKLYTENFEQFLHRSLV
jgi:hypothetical protein